jgi:lipid A 3-O-deacylase
MLLCSVSAAAFADGMPFEQPAPKQDLKPIDQSLSVPPQAAPVAAAPAAAPAPLPPPVPETRTVDVQPDTSFFGLSVGMYDPIDQGSKSTAFNVEWQPGLKILGTLQPLFGAMATARGAMMGYAGLGVPFNITSHVFLMPSLSIGAYNPGNDYDLKRHIVERPGVELAYQFDDKSRLGVSFDVVTNGESFQGRDRSELLALTYTMPLSALSGSSSPESDAPAATAMPVAAPVAPATMSPAKPVQHELP